MNFSDKFVARLWSFSSGADQEPAIAGRTKYYRYALVFGGLGFGFIALGRLAAVEAPRTPETAPPTIQSVAGASVIVCIAAAFICLVLDAFARRSVGRMLLYGSNRGMLSLHGRISYRDARESMIASHSHFPRSQH